jgi:hypothetical protein
MYVPGSALCGQVGSVADTPIFIFTFVSPGSLLIKIDGYIRHLVEAVMTNSKSPLQEPQFIVSQDVTTADKKKVTEEQDQTSYAEAPSNAESVSSVDVECSASTQGGSEHLSASGLDYDLLGHTAQSLPVPATGHGGHTQPAPAQQGPISFMTFSVLEDKRFARPQEWQGDVFTSEVPAEAVHDLTHDHSAATASDLGAPIPHGQDVGPDVQEANQSESGMSQTAASGSAATTADAKQSSRSSFQRSGFRGGRGGMVGQQGSQGYRNARGAGYYRGGHRGGQTQGSDTAGSANPTPKTGRGGFYGAGFRGGRGNGNARPNQKQRPQVQPTPSLQA